MKNFLLSLKFKMHSVFLFFHCFIFFLLSIHEDILVMFYLFNLEQFVVPYLKAIGFTIFIKGYQGKKG